MAKKIYICKNGKRNYCGRFMRELRSKKEITQEKMCELLEEENGIEISQESLSKIESGDTPIYDYELLAIFKLLDGLDLQLGEFYSY